MHLHVRSAVALSALGLLLAACGDDDGADTAAEDTTTTTTAEVPAEDGETTTVTMQDADGEDVGTVTLTEWDGGVQVAAALEVADADGFHGFHVHGTPECDPDADDGPFTTAGGHWGGDDADHADHTGDLPPLLFRDDGTATQVATTDRFTLEELLDAGGAIILHADRDNQGHIPDRYQSEDADEAGPDEATLNTGDAGDRIACGVVDGDDADDDADDSGTTTTDDEG
jgi:superoxide dismutase, Cu-Zn family